MALRWGLGAPPDLDVRGAPKRPALNHGWECDEGLPRRDVRKGKDPSEVTTAAEEARLH